MALELNKHNDISKLWLDYREGIYYYILKLVEEKDTANHLSHEVLLKIYSSCCSGRQIRNIRSWLFQIAHNTCIDYFREEGKKTDLNHEDFASIGISEDYEPYRRGAELLEPLIEILPEKYAVPLTLSEIQLLKQKEVAKKLKLTLSATKSRIRRGKQMLKEVIKECVHLDLDSDGRMQDFKVKSDCLALNGFRKEKEESLPGQEVSEKRC